MSVRSMSNELQASELKSLRAPKLLSLRNEFTLVACRRVRVHAGFTALLARLQFCMCRKV